MFASTRAAHRFEFSVTHGIVPGPDKAQLWLSVMMSEGEKPAEIDQLDSIQDVERLLSKLRTQFHALSLNETHSGAASILWRASWHAFVSESRWSTIATEDWRPNSSRSFNSSTVGAATYCESLLNQRACARRNNRLRRRRLPTRHPAHNSPRSASSIPTLRHGRTTR